MLSMTDTPIEKFVSYFAETNTNVAFLVPTPTGYEKSIMDATKPLRELLKYAGVHDYEKQEQGQENKVVIESHFITKDDLINTTASLYRPNTKHGDPRIWFSDLKKYCKPCNLLAVIIYDKSLYVINLSDKKIQESLFKYGHVKTGQPVHLVHESMLLKCFTECNRTNEFFINKYWRYS